MFILFLDLHLLQPPASISGFNDQYIFYGFLPKKEKQLENTFKNLSVTFDYSISFFYSIKKISFYIQNLKIIF